jgi:hypothetical protein
MDPPEIYVENPYSLMIVNRTGGMKRLYTPFRVQVQADIGNLSPDTWVYVDQVQEHDKHLIIYRVSTKWFPYKYFRLPTL